MLSVQIKKNMGIQELVGFELIISEPQLAFEKALEKDYLTLELSVYINLKD